MRIPENPSALESTGLLSLGYTVILLVLGNPRLGKYITWTSYKLIHKQGKIHERNH